MLVLVANDIVSSRNLPEVGAENEDQAPNWTDARAVRCCVHLPVETRVAVLVGCNFPERANAVATAQNPPNSRACKRSRPSCHPALVDERKAGHIAYWEMYRGYCREGCVPSTQADMSTCCAKQDCGFEDWNSQKKSDDRERQTRLGVGPVSPIQRRLGLYGS